MAIAQEPTTALRLLAGPGLSAGRETLAAHTARVGPLPSGGTWLLAALAQSGLRGRGGARFPTVRKWDAVWTRAGGHAVVVINGAEGEPASAKDQLLMSLRPHLVLDGAQLAAETVGATEVVLYVNRAFTPSIQALQAAIAERERSRTGLRRVTLLTPPPRYVAGEETAVVRWINGGEAKPASVPPRPFEKGVGGRPTLVQNVETTAMAALIGRQGPEWFRALGTEASPGTTLLTVSGAVAHPGVYEIAHGGTLGAAVAAAGGLTQGCQAVLLGGYFGTWVPARRALSLHLDDDALSKEDLKLGCGVVHVLPEGVCGVAETARILRFLALESARQCGPCMYGLDDLATLVEAIAAGKARAGEFAKLERWAAQLAPGRGACKHPDGAVGMLRSAWASFKEDFEFHRRRPCLTAQAPGRLPTVPAPAGWR